VRLSSAYHPAQCRRCSNCHPWQSHRHLEQMRGRQGDLCSAGRKSACPPLQKFLHTGNEGVSELAVFIVTISLT
jgi:hypothetical protein